MYFIIVIPILLKNEHLTSSHSITVLYNIFHNFYIIFFLMNSPFKLMSQRWNLCKEIQIYCFGPIKSQTPLQLPFHLLNFKGTDSSYGSGNGRKYFDVVCCKFPEIEQKHENWGRCSIFLRKIYLMLKLYKDNLCWLWVIFHIE